MHRPSLLHRGVIAKCITSRVRPRTPPVHNTDWLKTSRSHRGRGWPFRPFLHGRRPLVGGSSDAFGGSAYLLLPGLRGEPWTVPLYWISARCHPDGARWLATPDWTWGGTEHSSELRAHPPRSSLRTKLLVRASRLGRRSASSSPRTFLAVLPLAGGDCRLRRGGPAVGAARPYASAYMSTADQRPAQRAQPSSAPPAARDVRERGPDAPAGLLCRCGRLHLAGAKGIHRSPPIELAAVILLVGFMSLGLCLFVRGPSPIPTSRARSSRITLHRQAHPGNLRHPACRFRTPCRIGARSRSLIEFSMGWTGWDIGEKCALPLQTVPRIKLVPGRSCPASGLVGAKRRGLRPHVAGRRREPAHLRHRLTRQPENPGRLALAMPLDENEPPHRCVIVQAIHPSPAPKPNQSRSG